MKISLADYVGEVGQAKAADAIGVHQTAISKAIRVGRQIFVNTLPDGKIKADLRKAARGRECQVRIPGICNGNPETTVLAHIRIAGLCGTGIKPPDLIATIACSSCHDEIDRRTHLVDAEYAKECALEGMARTQVIWLKEGKVKA